MTQSSDDAKHRFDHHVAVTPIEPGLYAATIHAEYNIGKVPNGGYQSAICSAAASHALGGQDVVNVTSYYLAPALPGPATLRVQVVKEGRTTSLAQVSLFQEDRERVRAMVLTGSLDAFEGPDHHELAPPEMPPPDACIRLDPSLPPAPKILAQVDTRLDPATSAFLRGERGSAELRAWMRLSDGRAPDPLALAMFADVLPPTSFNVFGVTGWVPTLELTTQIRRRPMQDPQHQGWIRVRVITRHVTAGHFEEDGELWDESGALVAVSRQRAMLLKR